MVIQKTDVTGLYVPASNADNSTTWRPFAERYRWFGHHDGASAREHKLNPLPGYKKTPGSAEPGVIH